jgi:glucose-6-phosphate 1-dehydrogenase
MVLGFCLESAGIERVGAFQSGGSAGTLATKVFAVEEVLRSVCCHYGAGIVGGKESFGCRQEPNVNPNSTLKRAAIKLRIDYWRWSGYSFFVYRHKRTPRLATTMVIRFKTPPLSMFATHEAVPISPNYLIFIIQHEEGITFQGRAKITGPTVRINSETDKRQPTTGYERLLSNCMVGDASLFHRSDMVEAAAPILEAWNNYPHTDFQIMCGYLGKAFPLQ